MGIARISKFNMELYVEQLGYELRDEQCRSYLKFFAENTSYSKQMNDSVHIR